MEDLDDEVIHRWTTACVGGLRLPEPNQFLAESFRIKSDEPSRHWPTVRKISDDPRGELWFKADEQFNLPRGLVAVALRRAETRNNATTSVMLDFTGTIMHRMLIKEIDAANIASIHCQISSMTDGFQIRLEGVNDKMGKLLQIVVSQLVNFAPSDEEFCSFKDLFLADLKSQLLNVSRYGGDFRTSILRKIKIPTIEKRKAMESVTKHQFTDFLADFARNCWAQGLIQGNFYEKEANQMFQDVLQTLNNQDVQYTHDIQVLQLPESPHLVKRQNLNPADQNSFQNWYWQLGKIPISQEVRYDLLASIMREPVFDFLRTKKQLGYAVYCQLHSTDNVAGISITVRSQRAKFSVEEVKVTVAEFLTLFEKQLADVTDDEFNESKAGVIEQKSVEDTKLRQSFNRNLHELHCLSYNFDRRKQEIGEMKKLTKEDVVNAYVEGLLRNKRLLITCAEGNLPDCEDAEFVEKNLDPGHEFADCARIIHISEFRSNHCFISST